MPLCAESLLSGVLFGRQDEMIVDNICSPTKIFGIGDGKGYFEEFSEIKFNDFNNY